MPTINTQWTRVTYMHSRSPSRYSRSLLWHLYFLNARIISRPVKTWLIYNSIPHIIRNDARRFTWQKPTLFESDRISRYDTHVLADRLFESATISPSPSSRWAERQVVGSREGSLYRRTRGWKPLPWQPWLALVRTNQFFRSRIVRTNQFFQIDLSPRSIELCSCASIFRRCVRVSVVSCPKSVFAYAGWKSTFAKRVRTVRGFGDNWTCLTADGLWNRWAVRRLSAPRVRSRVAVVVFSLYTRCAFTYSSPTSLSTTSSTFSFPPVWDLSLTLTVSSCISSVSLAVPCRRRMNRVPPYRARTHVRVLNFAHTRDQIRDALNRAGIQRISLKFVPTYLFQISSFQFYQILIGASNASFQLMRIAIMPFNGSGNSHNATCFTQNYFLIIRWKKNYLLCYVILEALILRQ